MWHLHQRQPHSRATYYLLLASPMGEKARPPIPTLHTLQGNDIVRHGAAKAPNSCLFDDVGVFNQPRRL